MRSSLRFCLFKNFFIDYCLHASISFHGWSHTKMPNFRCVFSNLFSEEKLNFRFSFVYGRFPSLFARKKQFSYIHIHKKNNFDKKMLITVHWAVNKVEKRHTHKKTNFYVFKYHSTSIKFLVPTKNKLYLGTEIFKIRSAKYLQP